MPITTNFNGSLHDGVLIPAGNRRHVTLRNIANAIVSLSGGLVAEVTDAAPTPSALWPYASNVPYDVDNTTSPSAGHQITFYLTTDPELPNGHCRLFRIILNSATLIDQGFGLQLLDTRTGATTFGEVVNVDLVRGIAASLFTSGSTNATLAFDLRLFIWYGANILAVSIFEAATGGCSSCLVITFPDLNPYDAPRTEVPYLGGFVVTEDLSTIYSGFAPSAYETGGAGAGTLIYQGMLIDSAKTTYGGKAPAVPVFLGRTRSPYTDFGVIPGIYLMNIGHIGSLQSFALGGNTYRVIGRSSLLAVVMDLTT